MTVPLPETEDGRISEDALHDLSLAGEWAHAVAIGPGWGWQGGDGIPLITGLLQTYRGPLVIDADGLNSLAALEAKSPTSTGKPSRRRKGRAPDAPWNWWEFCDGDLAVVTPHPGEMARLREAAGLPQLKGSDDETRLRIAHEYAQLTGLTVVLKGHRTVVCTPNEAYVNTSGNPGMATGGMGDVLTGLIAALLGQGLNAFDAARLGVYCHGLAAGRCAKRIGPVGYLAREVGDMLPGALAEASQPKIGFK
jgi:NAD(P)H-hydrate epimerase